MAESPSVTHSILVVASDASAGAVQLDVSAISLRTPMAYRRCVDPGAGTGLLLAESGDHPDGPAVGLVVSLLAYEGSLDPLLSGFFRQVGPFATHVAVVCPRFDGRLLAVAYEYGVESFFTMEQWQHEGQGWLAALDKSLTGSVWRFAHGLTRMLRSGDHVGLQRALLGVDRNLECDYRVNFVVGKAQEVLGNFPAAAGSFKNAMERNPHFVLAKAAYAATLSQMGQKDEALQIQEGLQKQNGGSVERQLALAALHMERGDLAKAEEFATAAEKFSGVDPRALEARAQILLTQGNTKDLMPLLDQIGEGGQLLAARLNDMAINMAKAGNIAGALELYRKTHKIVRSDLKFKVTLNIALTYLKTQQFEKCTQALDQCENEFGGPFEKLTKMREVVVSKRPAA